MGGESKFAERGANRPAHPTPGEKIILQKDKKIVEGTPRNTSGLDIFQELQGRRHITGKVGRAASHLYKKLQIGKSLKRKASTNTISMIKRKKGVWKNCSMRAKK